MYGYIYITTNQINNTKYIGKHTSESFDESYKGSGKILLQAIKKYGWDNFSCSILESVNGVPTQCSSEDELNYAEDYYIKYYDCVNSKDYYNLKPGGLGKSCSGVIYITNGVDCRKVFPDELDYYFSIGYYKGGPKPTKETIEKRAKSNTGKKRSEETIHNLSKWQKGVPKSEEFKTKLRHQKSKPNWKQGKVSVQKDGKIYWVPKEDLQTYLDNGYIHKGPKWSKNN